MCADSAGALLNLAAIGGEHAHRTPHYNPNPMIAAHQDYDPIPTPNSSPTPNSNPIPTPTPTPTPLTAGQHAQEAAVGAMVSAPYNRNRNCSCHRGYTRTLREREP